jgi:chloramphenicol-sensitive protein RarD
MVAHRVLWAMPVMVLLVAWRGRLREVVAALRDSGHRTLLVATALLISVNWLVFVWAVQTGHVLETSLGYFVSPLVYVALGYVFLGELRRLQAAAARAAGVVWLMALLPALGALFLAVTFAVYGPAARQADALVGLTVETVFLAPVAAAYVALFVRGESAWLSRGAGGAASSRSPASSRPCLLWFAIAARRSVSTLGFFQYLAPTGQFFLAVSPTATFTSSHAVASAIWCGSSHPSGGADRPAVASEP